MRRDIRERTIEIARYIVAHECTVRDAAKCFGVSKSTVHKDVSERLLLLDRKLFECARKVLDVNLSERHLRGGEATRHKFLEKKVDAGKTSRKA